MEAIRVGALEALAEYGPSVHPKKILYAGFFILLGASVITSVALNGFVDEWSYEDLIGSAKKDSFDNHAGDCFWISMAQLVVYPLIIRLAMTAAREDDSSKDGERRSKDRILPNCPCFRCCYFGTHSTRGIRSSLLERTSSLANHSSNATGNGIGAVAVGSTGVNYNPLNNIDVDETSHGRCNSICDRQPPAESFEKDTQDTEMTSIRSSPGESSSLPPNRQQKEGYEAQDEADKNDTRESDERFLKSREAANRRVGICLGILFVVSTAEQVYLGLKCISFSFKNERRDGFLMGLGVLYVNLIVWMVRQIISLETRAEGELIKALHPHRLHLHLALAAHWCDLCGQQIKGGRAYRCKLCDFDLCLHCYSKKNKLSLEGQLRGDKGLKYETALTSDKYFWRAIKLVQGEWRLFAGALICLLCANGLSLFAPSLQGSILDAVVRSSYSDFNKWVLIYLLVSLCSGFIGGLQSLCFSIVGRKLANTIRCRLYKGIIVQDVAFFDGNASGQLTSRLTNDVGTMVTPIQSMLGTLVSNTILLIGGVGFCFYTSWRLSMLAFTTIGPIVHMTQIYAAWSQHLNRQILAALAVANTYATEALNNIRTVKAFSTESVEQEQYFGAIQVALSKGIRDAFGSAGMYTISNYLDLGTGVLILWYGGTLAMAGDDGLSPGRLITYQLYWNMMNNAYKGLLDIVTSFTRAGGAAQRVFSLIDSLPDIDVNAGVPVTKLHGTIELEDVHFSYQMRSDVKVLESVSLCIPAGTTCALVGKSGGGKSTIVSLIMRFYDPQEGCLKLDGRDLRELRLRDVRRHIGVVQQNTELFGGTIEENIAYGLDPGSWTRADVIEAATKACAHEFIKDFPDGYATRVGERGVRISGGQRQRIAIARVFLRKPKILLLDEATSALDAESEGKVQEALDRLISEGGATIVLVAHRLSTVVNANQIAVISDGKIVECGTHDDLLAREGQYYKLVQKQIRKKNEVVNADDIHECAAAGAEADSDVEEGKETP